MAIKTDFNSKRVALWHPVRVCLCVCVLLHQLFPSFLFFCMWLWLEVTTKKNFILKQIRSALWTFSIYFEFPGGKWNYLLITIFTQIGSIIFFGLHFCIQPLAFWYLSKKYPDWIMQIILGWNESVYESSVAWYYGNHTLCSIQ